MEISSLKHVPTIHQSLKLALSDGLTKHSKGHPTQWQCCHSIMCHNSSQDFYNRPSSRWKTL